MSDVLPPGAVLTIWQGRLRLRRTTAAHRERAPIDVFFTALAEDQAEHAIGIILSGGGSDGTIGFKAIKENGGLTVAQGADTTRPRFAEMPLSAVGAGFVDLLLPVQDMPERIFGYVRNWGSFDAERPAGGSPRFTPCCTRAPGTISANTRTGRFSAACSAACRWCRPRSSRSTPSGCDGTRKRSAPCFATC